MKDISPTQWQTIELLVELDNWERVEEILETWRENEQPLKHYLSKYFCIKKGDIFEKRTADSVFYIERVIILNTAGELFHYQIIPRWIDSPIIDRWMLKTLFLEQY